MASSTVASRTPRPRHTVDNDDAVMARALAFSTWARNNARVILYTAAAVLLAAGAALYVRYYRAERQAAAATDFMEVQQKVTTEATPQAVKDLNAFIGKHDGTNEADEARLALAELHLRGNDAKAALPPLREVAGRSGSPLSIQGGMMLAAAQAQAGDLAAAEKTYLDTGDRGTLDFQRMEAWNEAALLREQAGNWKGAAELYEKMVPLTDKGSLERSITEMRLAEARGHAAGK
ncbi:MAG TPA: tetratricopeptide repeat protein [Longimicrobiaceae bacterium]|jgi:predicted negative regulator of RcsB-dependent stress response|nr:tetratricopeptide repeat protein [Longimicrobiaceae bacterium]